MTKDHFTMENDTDSGLPISWPNCLSDKQLDRANVGIPLAAIRKMNTYLSQRRALENKYHSNAGQTSKTALGRDMRNLTKKLLVDLSSIFRDDA